jgi:hypothetical protein
MEIISINSTHDFSTIRLKKWEHFQGGEAELTQAQHKPNTPPTHAQEKTVDTKGEAGAQESKKDRINIDPIKPRTKRLGKRELNLLLSSYYQVFDPRHPAYREDFPNAQDLAKWEAQNGPWSPPPKHPEDYR